jgi:hypothetical protein
MSIPMSARLITLVVGCLSAGGLSLPAQASTIVYTDPAAFAAVTSSPMTYGFNGILAPGQAFASFNPLVVGPLSFSDPVVGVAVNVTTATFYSPNVYPADFIVDSGNPNPDNTLIVDTPATHALALDFGGLGFKGGSTSTLLALPDGFSTTEAPNPTVGNTEFVGFVSTDLITSLQLTSNNDDYVALDFTLASIPVSEPEPTSLAMLVTGLIGLGAALRRRRERA